MTEVADTVVARATPANPVPGKTIDRSIPSPERRNLPPELGPDAIAILEGRTFMYSDAVGDVVRGTIGGLIHADTRFLDQWVLTVDGERLLALRSGTVDHYSAAFYLTNPRMEHLMPNALGIRRLRFVGDGLHERIEVSSYVEQPLKVELRLSVGNDFADLFEVKAFVRDRSAQITRDHAADGSRLVFRYTNEAFAAETLVELSTPADRVEADELVWDLDLPARGEWLCEIRVPLRLGPREIQPLHRDFGEAFASEGDDPVSRWLAQLPKFETDSAVLSQVVTRSARDLLALRIAVKHDGEEIVLPAAGLPWFLTLFGRDTLLTAYQAAAFGPRLARGALIALAALQGTKRDDFRDEEPGKIPHELRAGELTRLGLKPHSPYYGTADATILWLILLSEYWRWTRDDDLVVSLKDNALAALRWIDESGDLDGDGYVEYATRSAQGLGNQCWRDSWDGIQFADGAIPPLPIATCEIQGYVYDAKLRLAELADGPMADSALATVLRKEATVLQEQFERDFWIDSRGGFYAIALDGDKRQVDSLTSNIGQLLWSGIVPKERAGIIAGQLMSDALNSGWGVRTLSTDDHGFNPIGYHLGTVWPHDNSLIALGLARYGFRDEANSIATALLQASTFSNYRLPEAFAGYERSTSRFPIPYPTACSPQAWATGAPLALIRAMLGLNAVDGKLVLDPQLPDEIGRISISGLPAFGRKWDVEAVGSNGYVRLAR
ncbi:MAG: glycogen debranching N-terminal domain-containing protein [Chloroflexota bacterium]